MGSAASCGTENVCTVISPTANSDPGEKQPELLAEPLAARALDRIGGEGVAIDRRLEFLAEDIEPAA